MATISKQKKVKVVRQKLKLFRANEPLKSVLMWGINHSFTALNHMKPPAILLQEDFKAFMKVKIKHHSFNKENMPSRFKFKEYFPMVFQALREKFRVNKLDYWDSFTRNEPLWDCTRGKSGSRFLVTYNRQFVAKTISSEEVDQMQVMIEEYYDYVVNRNGQTLLPQYLGLYRLTVNAQETYILVMRNVFSPRLVIHKKYDLKVNNIYHHPVVHVRHSGHSKLDQTSCPQFCPTSTPRRRCKSLHLTSSSHPNRAWFSRLHKHGSKPLPTLKDNDFLNEMSRLNIGNEARTKLLELLAADIQFLQDNNLLDYSLLIGVHDVDSVSSNATPQTPNPSADATSNQSTTADQPPPGGPPVQPCDEIASAGDGLGSIQSGQWQVNPSIRYSICGANVMAGLNATLGGLAVGDDGEDEEGCSGAVGSSMSEMESQSFAQTAVFTTPDSPPPVRGPDQQYSDSLHPSCEFYGIKSSAASPQRRIYFVAIIDILTRYGMRKRTAQTYKSVKHGPGAETRPDMYGRRLLEFISQCVE